MQLSTLASADRVRIHARAQSRRPRTISLKAARSSACSGGTVAGASVDVAGADSARLGCQRAGSWLSRGGGGILRTGAPPPTLRGSDVTSDVLSKISARTDVVTAACSGGTVAGASTAAAGPDSARCGRQ